MRWTAALVFGLCGFGSLGCTQSKDSWVAPNNGQTSSPGDPVVVVTARCDGLCVETAPATYTGPSLFWIGAATAVQDCPPSTPYKGIEGWVHGPLAPTFARECRITPSDRCGEEGLTCAPMLEEDFHVCIHHDAETSCPSDYPQRSTVSEVVGDHTLTLCCQKSPVPS